MASILKAIKPVLTDFVGEVQRSLGYFTNTHRDAHVAHMVGLGSAFKLPGLQKYLADKLSLEVKKPTKFEKLSGDAVLNDPLFQENLLTFPIAYGLALQGLGQRGSRPTCSHRASVWTGSSGPRSPMRQQRRQPCLSAWGMAMGFSGPYAAITDKDIDKGIEMTKSAGTAYSGQESKYTTKLADSKRSRTRPSSSSPERKSG
ncbi:pilus assembly protein PilM [Gemmata sp. G18]|uniref:Pilus assembly protein PilM n=2 Tax=Gemmata palustris TaxID=2822762 RepID=A0ABS5BWB9_9BACT|nr:pilus assembly protein PilM [Gemmata palustris]